MPSSSASLAPSHILPSMRQWVPPWLDWAVYRTALLRDTNHTRRPWSVNLHPVHPCRRSYCRGRFSGSSTSPSLPAHCQPMSNLGKAQFMAGSEVPCGVGALAGAEQPCVEEEAELVSATTDEYLRHGASCSQRGGATVEESPASRAIYASRPAEVAAVIKKAVQA